MISPVGERDAGLVRLTQAAVEAAQRGQWDIVIQCYDERGVLLEALQGAPVSPAGDLLKLDEQVRDRVRTMQAVLLSSLEEAAATRQRLRSLHQRLSGQPSTAGTLSMKG